MPMLDSPTLLRRRLEVQDTAIQDSELCGVGLRRRSAEQSRSRLDLGRCEWADGERKGQSSAWVWIESQVREGILYAGYAIRWETGLRASAVRV
jgi:hypothetical protein